MADRSARYRREGDTWCVDLQIKHPKQLFDLRDPAPFRARDLDPTVVEYVTEALEEVPARAPLRVVVLLPADADASIPPGEIATAFRAHFTHALEVLSMRVRAHLRQGRWAILLGVALLTITLWLSELVTPEGATWRRLLHEGLVIGGWVAIWRPIEHFLYDWWPFLDERAKLRRLISAEVVVRATDRPSMLAVPVDHERAPAAP